MVNVDRVLELVLSKCAHAGSETLPILEARGRFLARDIVSSVLIPPLDNSAMDGFAVMHADTAAASKEAPAVLEITDEIQAGGAFEGIEVRPGKAVRIMTGAAVPAGADAVVPVEYTEERGGLVHIDSQFKLNDNIRFAGEDIGIGQTVLRAGDLLNPARIGLLASLNMTGALVGRVPSVAVISTGNEIVEAGEDAEPWKIRNSNAYTLISEINDCGAKPVYLGIARDTREDTIEKFRRAFECDIVISTGGVSMGDYDFVEEALEAAGVEILIRSVAMKPGKPMVFGVKDSKLFFGLPGNPVSTMISFGRFVRPAILKISGASLLKRPLVKALLTEDIKKKPGRRHFVRGICSIDNGILSVKSTGDQGSGILSSMSLANCIIILPEDSSLFRAGSDVMIELTGHGEIA
jgi:molybdopterin molybdotransferase